MSFWYGKQNLKYQSDVQVLGSQQSYILNPGPQFHFVESHQSFDPSLADFCLYLINVVEGDMIVVGVDNFFTQLSLVSSCHNFLILGKVYLGVHKYCGYFQ